MWVSAVLGLLTAIFKAFPSIESLVEMAIESSKKSRAAEALLRKSEKDNLVDKAINEGVKDDHKNS